MPKEIIVIRHGEKPKDKKDQNLSTEGVARSHYLVDYFLHPVVDANNKPYYDVPQLIYVFNKHKNQNRSAELAKFLIDSGIPSNANFNDDKKDTLAMVDDLFKSENDDKTLLVIWEHTLIPFLIQAIGSKIKKNLFHNFNYWSVDPINGKKGKDDGHLYSMTVVIDPKNKSAIGVQQSDDFNSTGTVLTDIPEHKILFTL